jgi:hypothetical protein
MMDSPPLSPAILGPADYPYSEVDSLSDSDWLELSSSRESDDNDSVCSRGSDREDDIGFRRSTSIGSSRDGDVDAWEGLVEDSGDEGTHAVPVVATISPHATTDNTIANAPAPSVHAGDNLVTIMENDSPDEEERLRAALDQSMISTLGSSRSSSLSHSQSTTGRNTRDIRLSFPDPLTSSRNDLNSSYEDVAPSDETFFTTDNTDNELSHPSSLSRGITLEEIDPEPSHENVVDSSDVKNDDPPVPDGDPVVEIVLYGVAAPVKSQFVHKLLQKLKEGTETPSAELGSQQAPGATPTFRVTDKTVPCFSQDVGSIFARNFNPLSSPSQSPSSNQPSLAVVFIPAPPWRLPEHTFYLPVLASLSDSEVISRSAAWANWRRFGVPDAKLLPLRELPVRSVRSFDHVPARDLRSALLEKRKERTTPLNLGNAHAAALYASVLRRKQHFAHAGMCSLTVLTLLLGLVINFVVRAPGPPLIPTPTADVIAGNSIWRVLQQAPNHSVAHPATTASDESCALVPSSLKDFALAVFNPTLPMALAPAPTRPVRRAAEQPTTETSNREPMTWSECVRSGKELILRPMPSSLSFDAHSKALSVIVPAQRKAEAIRSSVSTKLADSFAELFDTKALIANFRNDFKEIMDVLDLLMKAVARSLAACRQDLKVLVRTADELMHAIASSTNVVMQQSKGRAHRLRERLRLRNDVARKRAIQLKELGRDVVSTLKERAQVAKEKASMFKAATSEFIISRRKRVSGGRHGLRRRAKRRARAFLFRA